MTTAASHREWLDLAESSLTAAEAVRAGHPRSSVSRSYYAAFAAAHAIFLSQGESPRADMGTWPHDALGRIALTVVSRRLPPNVAKAARFALEESRRMRILADYGPRFSVGDPEAKEARRLAGQLVSLAKEFAA